MSAPTGFKVAPYIVTASGRKITPGGAEAPSLRDLAQSLARQPRFSGQTRREWSVLEHSLFCAELAKPEGRLLQLAMLLHDAHEALTGDIPSPLKTSAQRAVQCELDVLIMNAYFPGGWKAYGVLFPQAHAIDTRALLAEAKVIGPETFRTTEGMLEHFGEDAAPADIEQLVKFRRKWSGAYRAQMIDEFINLWLELR